MRPIDERLQNLFFVDPTTTNKILDESTTGKSSDNRANVELVAKWKRPTCFQSGIPQESQCNNSIEMDDRPYHAYNIINDEDVVDDLHLQRMQVQMSTEYMDVIRSSNSIASSKSKSETSYDTPCQDLLSGEKSKNNVDFRSWISGDIISSSSDEHQNTTQDYLNLYQPLIKVSQPKREEYLKLEPVNRIDRNSLNYKTSVISENEYIFPHSLQLGTCLLWQLHEHENFQVKSEFGHFQRLCSKIKGRVSKSCENLAINRLQKKTSSEKDDKFRNSSEDHAFNNTFKWKSESDIFWKISRINNNFK
ncbi:unnamed protein product [Mytilus edulis]|uniref:Uncharacterized protein n=1 Tax=Mytilus edulis TaxID=6550 RepID=A0A8S3RWX6_MYTED|nr:unnamed protein product [Mytilus edulis]